MRWYTNGQHWEGGSKVAAPSAGPFRIAFDAGREREQERKRKVENGDTDWPSILHARYDELPLDVWQRVLADHLRRDKYGSC